MIVHVTNTTHILELLPNWLPLISCKPWLPILGNHHYSLTFTKMFLQSGNLFSVVTLCTKFNPWILMVIDHQVKFGVFFYCELLNRRIAIIILCYTVVPWVTKPDGHCYSFFTCHMFPAWKFALYFTKPKQIKAFLAKINSRLTWYWIAQPLSHTSDQVPGIV